MIKVKNLEKYYNKRKSNEIHVIDDVSLELKEGLVVLLGPSGSGKTTLLNVLGGLDKVESGNIEFGDQIISRYSSSIWDKIRNQRIGYIFQNYNLLPNISVYENISLTLNMIGIYDKEELDKRIDYVLDKVGMLKFKKRRAALLSGGQQQRVAIARALAKNPDVIIADEPTGNLDSKNTHDIMRIVKSISKTKLVILVTHETDLANIYSDRIIKIADGKIVDDIQNQSSEHKGIKHETDIYLKDLNEQAVLTSDKINLTVLSDVDEITDLNVKLILKNNTLYLDLGEYKNHKVQVVNSQSEIKLLDKSYDKESIKQEDIDFDLDKVVDNSKKTSKRSVISLKDSLKMTYQRLRTSNRLGKLLYIGFAAGAILIAISISMFSSVLFAKPQAYFRPLEDIIIIEKGNMTYLEVQQLLENDFLDYIKPNDSIEIYTSFPMTYHAYNNYSSASIQQVMLSSVDPNDIIIGEMPANDYEILISEEVAIMMLDISTAEYSGVNTYQDLLGLSYYIDSGSSLIDISITGVVKDKSNVAFYTTELMYYQLISRGFGIYELFSDKVTLNQGDINDNGCIVLDAGQNVIDNEYKEVFNETYINVTGTYTTDEIILYNKLITLEAFKKIYFNSIYKSADSNIEIYSSNKQAGIEYLKTQNIDAKDKYSEYIKVFRNENLLQGAQILVFNFVVFGASAISYFFVIRSSLLSRIYEISVYRALGVSKGDIRKIFITEVVFITTITAFIAYSLTSYIIYRIQVLSGNINIGLQVTPLSFIGGLLLIYLINILSGIVPVSNLLRKTPSEINTKFDF